MTDFERIIALLEDIWGEKISSEWKDDLHYWGTVLIFNDDGELADIHSDY